MANNTPDKLAEAKKIIENWESNIRHNWGANNDILVEQTLELLAAQDLISRSEERKEIVKDCDEAYDYGYERGREEQKEIVICAAIKTKSGHLVRGHRHSDCFVNIHSRGIPTSAHDDQGFITSRNRFVGREEAFKLQKAAGIKSVDREGYHGNQLYSEDLY